MYHALITNRYLTSRLIPLIAVAAVALCVALVIIVVSVMTGFLDMVKSSGRTLMGDVVVSYQPNGIPYYDDLIERIEALPEAAAASPIVDGWGQLRMPYPDTEVKDIQNVQVWGIEPESMNRVTDYGRSLYWVPPEEDDLPRLRPNDFRRIIGQEDLARYAEDGRTLTNRRTDSPAIVLGLHVSIGNERQSDGSYEPVIGTFGPWFMPKFDVTLSVMTGRGLSVRPEHKSFQVVNEFSSGVFLIDKTRVMIPLEVAQEMLRLDQQQRVVEREDGEFVQQGIDPARVTMVLVRAADGVSPDQLRDAVDLCYHEFHLQYMQDADAAIKPPIGPAIQTWEQQQRDFIAPVEKERELMRTLFSLVYVVCAGLVLSIFWAIVYEKTRDIGILRSIGASRLGISWIFLRYGLVIGVLGAILGLGLGTLVVRNINVIHDGMADPPLFLGISVLSLALLTLLITILRSRSGRLLPVVLGSLITLTLLSMGVVIFVVKYVMGGFEVWDPAVYYFTKIPNQVDYHSAAFTMVGAVIFSLLGAFIPAAKAADTDPVKALRYE